MIQAQKAIYPVSHMCQLLEVSQSGYFSWGKRLPSKRVQLDQKLKEKIKSSFAASGKTYGSPRILKDLVDLGFNVSRKRVARLMKEEEWTPPIKKKYCRTTDSNHNRRIAPNVVNRKFNQFAPFPNHLWVSDITYIRTQQGWLYLCAFIDVFSRRVVGWTLEENMQDTMVSEALRKGLHSRHFKSSKLIIHSDRGSQYASDRFLKLLKKNKLTASMSRKGNCWDNGAPRTR